MPSNQYRNCLPVSVGSSIEFSFHETLMDYITQNPLLTKEKVPDQEWSLCAKTCNLIWATHRINYKKKYCYYYHKYLLLQHLKCLVCFIGLDKTSFFSWMILLSRSVTVQKVTVSQESNDWGERDLQGFRRGLHQDFEENPIWLKDCPKQ